MPGLLRGVARTAVVAGTATAVSNRVSRRQANRWADQEQQQYYEAPPQQSADPYAELEKLAELRDKGVLSDQEFQAQKARILNQ